MTGPTYVSGIIQVRAYRILQVYVAKVLKEFDLKPTHWFILGYINESEEATSATIADLLKVEPPLITGLTEDLIKQGLIEKKAHPTDGRVKLLKTTSKGKKLVPQIESALEESINKLLRGTSAHDLRIYKKVLEVIIANDK